MYNTRIIYKSLVMAEEQEKKKNWFMRHKVATILAVLFVIAGMASDSSKKKVETVPAAPVDKVEVPVVEQKSAVLFDVPSLYGKDTIDEVIKILGKPTDDREAADVQNKNTPEDLKLKEFNKKWEKDGYDFWVSYRVADRKVIDFFIDSGGPTGSTKDINKLKQLLNVENPKDFTVEPIKAKTDPSSYTGLLVKPIAR